MSITRYSSGMKIHIPCEQMKQPFILFYFLSLQEPVVPAPVKDNEKRKHSNSQVFDLWYVDIDSHNFFRAEKTNVTPQQQENASAVGLRPFVLTYDRIKILFVLAIHIVYRGSTVSTDVHRQPNRHERCVFNRDIISASFLFQSQLVGSSVGTNVCILNLPMTMTTPELRDMSSKYGKVSSVTMRLHNYHRCVFPSQT